MSARRHDVVIAGAGPAGATAAILLAQKGRRVALVDRGAFPRQVPSAGWLNARAAPLVGALGVPVTALLDRPFTDVTFYNANFTRRARPSFNRAPGFLVDRTALGNLLVSAAVAGGAELYSASAVTGIDRFEEHVVVHRADDDAVVGRLLILAVGRGAPLLHQLGFRPGAAAAPLCSAAVESQAGSAGEAPRVAVVLGLDDRGSFALCSVCGTQVSVSLNWYGDPRGARPVFAQVCLSFLEHGVIGVDLSSAAAAADIIVAPSAYALDMDTHVGKNMLVIGDAGGFVAAASNEGLYPAMWSGQIAAEVIDGALAARVPQDELMQFETRWRHAMADYLRPPHTDILFLLPLIFSNQAMANLMGAAFFSGENM